MGRSPRRLGLFQARWTWLKERLAPWAERSQASARFGQAYASGKSSQSELFSRGFAGNKRHTLTRVTCDRERVVEAGGLELRSGDCWRFGFLVERFPSGSTSREVLDAPAPSRAFEVRTNGSAGTRLCRVPICGGNSAVGEALKTSPSPRPSPPLVSRNCGECRLRERGRISARNCAAFHSRPVLTFRTGR
jgi:hypothetical protein